MFYLLIVFSVGSGGYKTAGFIEGMPLKSSAIVRAGLKLDL
ncbi:hypothetical protein [Rickettsia endosymbiont of Gonocerus acuteangulatus]